MTWRAILSGAGMTFRYCQAGPRYRLIALEQSNIPLNFILQCVAKIQRECMASCLTGLNDCAVTATALKRRALSVWWGDRARGSDHLRPGREGVSPLGRGTLARGAMRHGKPSAAVPVGSEVSSLQNFPRAARRQEHRSRVPQPATPTPENPKRWLCCTAQHS
jgi:hypothetical protein